MSKFREMTPQLLQSAGVRKKFKLLKYEQIIYHFKARDLEIPLILIFSKILKFHKSMSKTNFAKFLSGNKITDIKYYAKVIKYSKSSDHVL